MAYKTVKVSLIRIFSERKTKRDNWKNKEKREKNRATKKMVSLLRMLSPLPGEGARGSECGFQSFNT